MEVVECRLFGKNETFIMKAIGVSLMLIHHLFYDMEHLEGCSFFVLRGGTSLVIFAQMCKVCVALFVFLSGFGMYRGASKINEVTKEKVKDFWAFFKYSLSHILKLLFSYWWAVIPFAIFGILTGMRSFESVYGEGRSAYVAAVTDILGINYIRFGTEKMYNVTCWYLGVALALYLLFPVFKLLIDHNTMIFLGVSFLIGAFPEKILFSAHQSGFLHLLLVCFLRSIEYWIGLWGSLKIEIGAQRAGLYLLGLVQLY